MSSTSVTATNTPLAVSRRLLDAYMRDAAEKLSERRRRVGQRIRELREHAGMYQKNLGAIVSVDAQAVSNWERGVHLPELDTLSLIAEHFKVPVSYFFEEEGDVTQHAEILGELLRTEADNGRRLDALEEQGRHFAEALSEIRDLVRSAQSG